MWFLFPQFAGLGFSADDENASRSAPPRSVAVHPRAMPVTLTTFRPRDATALAAKRAQDASAGNICDLLDLSRYELNDRSQNDLDLQKGGPDDFEHRMRANIAALIFLVALAGLAATDVLKLVAHTT